MYEILNPQHSGRVIALWSPVSRQGAVSTTAALLASYMGKKVDDGRVLIISTDLTRGPDVSYYMTTEKMTNGLAEVIELSISDNLTSVDDIKNNTFSLTDNIDILPCSRIGSNVVNFLSRELSNILKVARRGYKYIVIDTVCGNYDIASKTALNSCDALIVCMPQDKYIFESWIRKVDHIYLPLVESKPTVMLSSMHFEYADMRYADMSKELKGTELFYLSLNDAVHKANSERNIPDLIAANMGSKRHKDDVINELEAIYNKLVEYIEEIIDEEIENENEIADEAKQETLKYLVVHNNDLFSSLYDDEVPDTIDEDASSELEYNYEDLMNPNRGNEYDMDEDIDMMFDRAMGMLQLDAEADIYGSDKKS